jgi:hypothetical protein
VSSTGRSARWKVCSALGITLLVFMGGSSAQPPTQFLDPTRDPSVLRLPPATSLTEQFIWTANDAAAWNPTYQASVRGQNDKTEPHAFRAHFTINTLPQQATLYLAGPRSASVFLNGIKVLEFDDSVDRGRGFNVMTADVAGVLRLGENVIAIRAVRGHNSLHTGASALMNHVTYGEVLLVKIVPKDLAEDAPPVLVSDARWRSTATAIADWQSATLDDSAWPDVESIGAPGSRRDFCSGTWMPVFTTGQDIQALHRTCASFRLVRRRSRKSRAARERPRSAMPNPQACWPVRTDVTFLSISAENWLAVFT